MSITALADTRILTVDLSYAGGDGSGSPMLPNTYGSINEAIRAASDGDTIVLKAGSYEEKILLDKNVHIAVDPEAEPGDTVVTSGCICTIPQSSTASATTMMSSTSPNNNSNVDSPAVASLRGGGSITNLVIQQLVDIRAGSVILQNCELTMGSDGIRVCTGANPTIRQCKIHNCQNAGIYLQEGAGATIVGCDISNVRGDGIHCNRTRETLDIRENNIHHCANGVYFRRGARGNAEGNVISSVSQFGVYIQSASEPTIVRNQVETCGIHGIFISKEGSGSIKDNAVSGSVRVYKGCTPTLGTNVVSGVIEAEAVHPSPVTA